MNNMDGKAGSISALLVSEEEAKRVIGPEGALDVLELFFRERGSGKTVTPPRMHVDSSEGNMVFTAGGSEDKKIMGFRVYTSYGNDDQFIAVYNSGTGNLRGIVFGSYVGSLRTAAIGSLSIKYMARKDAKVLGVIGSGTQAFFQAISAIKTNNFEQVEVYSPNREHSASFASRVREISGVEVMERNSARDVAGVAEVLILATKSSEPVIYKDWVRKGCHIISVGKKFVSEHEIDPEIPQICTVVATDSKEQLKNYPEEHFMAKSKKGDSIVDLSRIISSELSGRKGKDDITLFLSVGLSGTEVMIANEIINRIIAEQLKN